MTSLFLLAVGHSYEAKFTGKRSSMDWMYISQEWLLCYSWVFLKESHGQMAMDIGQVWKSGQGHSAQIVQSVHVGLRMGTRCGLSANRSQICVDTWMG